MVKSEGPQLLGQTSAGYRPATGLGLLTGLTWAAGQVMSVQVRTTQMRSRPSFLGSAVAEMTYGTQVKMVTQQGPWVKVTSPQGKTGWLHESALSEKDLAMVAGGTEAATGASGEEIALAGKGFNAQVEKEYRKQNQDLDFKPGGPHGKNCGHARAGRGLPGRRTGRPRLKEVGNMPRCLTFRRVVGILVSLILTAGAAWWLVGCASVAKVATDAAQATGHIDEDQAESLHRGIDAVDMTFQDITPEQEYYIGRAVTARMFTSYRASDHDLTNVYLNELGQTLAMASDRPETFGGYHFQLIETDEINAFAAPGGLILVSTACWTFATPRTNWPPSWPMRSGTWSGKHGLRAIKNSRLTSAITILASESAQNFGSEDLKQLVEDYEGSIDDVATTLMVKGYSRDLEEEADRIAITILERVGYDPKALTRMLAEMQKQLRSGGPGFARTHPAPKDRIDAISPSLAGLPDRAEPAVRHERFAAAAAGP